MRILKSFSFPEGNIRGDMFYIKHTKDNFTVIDCFLKDGDGKNCRQSEIIDEVVKESQGRVCRFISTHPDKDHIQGIEELDKKWPILNFYAVNNQTPADKSDPSLTRYLQLLSEKNCAIYRGLKRAWLNKDAENKCSSGLSFLWPKLDNEKFKNTLKSVAEGGSPNNISCVIKYAIADGPSYLWMGDMETDMQQEFYDSCHSSIPQIDILFQPHHGRESGMVPSDLLKALNPKLIIIGNAPSENIHYGNPDITITQNEAGDILFENGNSRVDIYTKNEIDNVPKCLVKDPELGDKGCQYHGWIFVEWHYCGTLYL